MSSFNQKGLKLMEIPEALGLLLKRGQGKQPKAIQCGNQSEEHLGHTRGRLVVHLRICPRVAAFMERSPLGTKELADAISLPYPSAKMQTHPQEPEQCANLLPNLLTSSPALLHFGGTALPSYTCPSPSMAGLLPRRPAQSLPKLPPLDPEIWQSLSSGTGGKGLIALAYQSTHS